MKRIIAVLLPAAMSLLLASCASLLGPREMDIPLARLQEALSRQFPFNNRYLELFDVYLTNPKIALQPEGNRILTSMDASIAPPFLNQSWKGNFAFSGQLKFDAARNALVLTEPRMENFTGDGLNGQYAGKLARVGGLLAAQLLKDYPIYTFKPEDLRYGGSNFKLSKITTKSNGLVVTFVPTR